MAIVCALALVDGAGADLITFEEFGTRPTGFTEVSPLSSEYDGLFFTGPGEGDGGAILNGGSGFGIAPRSGEQFFAFNETYFNSMQNGGTPTGPETIIFTGSLMSHVEIYAAGGANDSGAAFLMEAFDDNGDVVGVSTVSAQGTWGLLSVSSSLGIRVVRLTQTGTDRHYVYDDLGFTPVPGPGAGVILAGAAGLAGCRRRRTG
jgi:hypothetical protein